MFFMANSAFVCVIIAGWLIVSLAFAIPTAISASRRQMNPLGWGTLTFLTWLSGLAIFLIFIKPKKDEIKCRECGKMIPTNHIYCPFCGHRDN